MRPLPNADIHLPNVLSVEEGKFKKLVKTGKQFKATREEKICVAAEIPSTKYYSQHCYHLKTMCIIASFSKEPIGLHFLTTTIISNLKAGKQLFTE